MTIAVRISKKLVKDVKLSSKTQHRTIGGQIERWADIGRTLQENPELGLDEVRKI